MEKKSNKLDFQMFISLLSIAIVLVDRLIATFRFVGLVDYKSAIHALFSIVMALTTLWYLTMGYKKPHGSSMKLVFIMFTLYLAHHSSVDLVYKDYLYSGYGLLLASLIMSYTSGRLNKISKNKSLLLVVLICLIVDVVYHILVGEVLSLLRIISLSSPILLFISICLSYFNRYEAHIEAGLND